MNRFLIALAVLLATLSCACVSAQTVNVQHDGVTVFCAQSLSTINGPNWNFTGTCALPPPPPPPANDPLAASPLFFKYTAHICTSASAPNGQDFAAVYGSAPGQSAILPWPFRPNSVQYLIPAGKRYSATWSMPANPGTVYHAMKGDPYAGQCGGSSAGVRVNVSVIATGTTPAPTGTCSKLNAVFDGGPWLYLDPMGGTLQADAPASKTAETSKLTATSAQTTYQNPYRCNMRPLGTYRFIIQTVDGRAATMLTTWN